MAALACPRAARRRARYALVRPRDTAEPLLTDGLAERTEPGAAGPYPGPSVLPRQVTACLGAGDNRSAGSSAAQAPAALTSTTCGCSGFLSLVLCPRPARKSPTTCCTHDSCPGAAFTAHLLGEAGTAQRLAAASVCSDAAGAAEKPGPEPPVRALPSPRGLQTQVAFALNSAVRTQGECPPPTPRPTRRPPAPRDGRSAHAGRGRPSDRKPSCHRRPPRHSPRGCGQRGAPLLCRLRVRFEGADGGNVKPRRVPGSASRGTARGPWLHPKAPREPADTPPCTRCQGPCRWSPRMAGRWGLPTYRPERAQHRVARGVPGPTSCQL